MRTSLVASVAISLICVAGTAAANNVTNSPSPADHYMALAAAACDNAERQLPEMTKAAEIVALRHIAGGVLGVLWDGGWCVGQGMEEELVGRSGQIMNFGFGRAIKPDRTDAEKTNDVLFAGWFKAPATKDLARLQEFKNLKCYIVGLGPRDLPELAEHVKLCDFWMDTGYGTNDFAVTLPDGSKAGHGNLLSNTMNAWAFIGEVIAALTRQGKMPVIAKSYGYEDGTTWWNKYFQKMLFHDDYTIAPLPAGKLGREYIDYIRGLLTRYSQTQLPAVQKTADLIATEFQQGRKTVVAEIGHMPWAFTATDEAAEWAIPSIESVYAHLPDQWPAYYAATADNALVLRLGYMGFHIKEQDVFKKKNQRVMLISAENPRPEWKMPNDLLANIDMGYAFGDACVSIPGYPIKALPPSAVMQLVAYETVNVEVLSRIHQDKKAANK